MVSEEAYLLQLAESHLDKAGDKNNKNSRIDYRLSGFAIVNFYSLSILRAGEELDLDIKESYKLERKVFVVSQELPKLLKHNTLFDEIDNIRNSLAHTDISIPDVQKLTKVINRAEEFRKYIGTLVSERKNAYKKKRSLKEEYQEKIDFIKLWFKYPDKRFMENIAKQSERIKDVLDRLAHFRKIKVEQLDNDSIRNLLTLLDQTLKETELIYETIYNYCPKCGGNIIITTEQVTHYVGPYDDPEPDSFTIWQVAKCEKCGAVFEREHITTEYI